MDNRYHLFAFAVFILIIVLLLCWLFPHARTINNTSNTVDKTAFYINTISRPHITEPPQKPWQFVPFPGVDGDSSLTYTILNPNELNAWQSRIEDFDNEQQQWRGILGEHELNSDSLISETKHHEGCVQGPLKESHDKTIFHHLISRGKDSLAFFRRIGQTYVVLIFNERHDIVARLFLILKQLKDGKSIWYVSDLRVSPTYQRRHVSTRLFKALAQLRDITPIIYGICMEQGAIVPLRRIVEANQSSLSPYLTSKFQELDLFIFALSYGDVLALEKELTKHVESTERRCIMFVSLEGEKDVWRISKERAPHKLSYLHASIVGTIPAQKSYKHLFCALQNSPLFQQFTRLGFRPFSKGLFFYSGFEDLACLGDLSTSEI